MAQSQSVIPLQPRPVRGNIKHHGNQVGDLVQTPCGPGIVSKEMTSANDRYLLVFLLAKSRDDFMVLLAPAHLCEAMPDTSGLRELMETLTGAPCTVRDRNNAGMVARVAFDSQDGFWRVLVAYDDSSLGMSEWMRFSEVLLHDPVGNHTWE